MELRRTLNRFLSHLATELVIALLIMASVALLLFAASMPSDSALKQRLELINDLITYVFVLELLLRFLTEKSKRRFISRFWLDILAVLPLFRGFRLLRILRLLRLFRLGVILSGHSRLFLGAFWVVKSEYVFAGLGVVVAVLMGALSLRFTEGRESAAFGTIEDALWFAVMTVAAGEPTLAEPTSRLGRVVTLSLMLGGMTIFAFFAGTVSAVMIESMRKLRSRPMDPEEFRDHVIICGWNAAGKLIVDELVDKASDHHIVVIAEAQPYDSLPERVWDKVTVLREDFTKLSVLKQAGIERAGVAILLADESRAERSAQDRDARVVLAALLIEKLNTGIYTTVQLNNRANEVTLREAGVEDIIVSDEYVSGVMASVVRNRGIAPMLEELLTAKYGNQFFKCAAPQELIGKTVEEAMVVLKSHYNATLLAIEVLGTRPSLQVNPASELVLTDRHRIVVAAKQPPVKPSAIL